MIIAIENYLKYRRMLILNVGNGHENGIIFFIKWLSRLPYIFYFYKIQRFNLLKAIVLLFF